MINPKVWISGDHHFNHTNILLPDYDNRPFKNIQDHNQKIISNHNEMVKPEDVCYFLGDVYFRGGKEAGKTHYWEFLKQMNGRITIIRGNHEKQNSVIDKIQSAIMHISGIRILATHDPINATTDYDLILHAHVHKAFTFAELHEKGKISLLINCGVTQWNYRPVSWTKLFEIYQQWKVGKIKAQLFDKKLLKKIREERRKR